MGFNSNYIVIIIFALLFNLLFQLGKIQPLGIVLILYFKEIQILFSNKRFLANQKENPSHT